MNDKYEVLRTYFGYNNFRPGQGQLIDEILNGSDAFGIMPTGAGKSLCYQVPAMVLPGITLVISPLISLMQDQVHSLIQLGIPAAYINSNLTKTQVNKVIANMISGKYKIIYIAPERLLSDRFLYYADQMTISLISVDEAHCVSQWGQDFRPSYLDIEKFISSINPRPVVGAFTATATEKVKKDIVKLLNLQKPYTITTGFNRENLYFEVQTPPNRYEALLEILKQKKDKSGIIYCLTRKDVESICEKLRQNGYEATRYHAGLSEEERKENQENFQADRFKIMVATNAFGMGIDKSNVSYVIHYGMPKNLESFYQEAGRAGRDGSTAQCILLFNGKDIITNKYFIDHSEPIESMAMNQFELFKENEREKLNKMALFCRTQSCLRQYILNYFNEEAPENCGNCSNCLQVFNQTDITIAAQKILSCVKRLHERYGIKLIVDILKGAKNKRIFELRLDQISTYGIMSDLSEFRIREIIDFLILNDYLYQTSTEYPIIKLGRNARTVLIGKETLYMNARKQDVADRKIKEKGKKIFHDENPVLFIKLQELRKKIAQEKSLPAYIIFSDATLYEMCDKKPINEYELLQISGVGQVKAKKYGSMFIEVIRKELG